jgi:GAF domain-containing protein
LVNRESQCIEVAASHGDGKGFLDHLPLGLGQSRSERVRLPAQVVTEGRASVVDDIRCDPRVVLQQQAGALGLRSVAILPIKLSGEVVGLLALYSGDPAFFDATEMRLLEELAGDIGFAIGHIVRDERLRYVAMYDALTGLPNRDALSGKSRSICPAGATRKRKGRRGPSRHRALPHHQRHFRT